MGLVILTLLGGSLAGVADQPLPSLDTLLQEYKALGLPIPPRETKLVRWELKDERDKEKPQLKFYKIALQIKPGTRTDLPGFLVGTNLRTEILHQFSDPKETRYRRERLQLLASFLEDSDSRNRLEVRDFVAMEIARLLGITVKDNQKGTAQLRSQITEAVQRELDKPGSKE
jgi:hypothetical protein